VVDPNDGRRYGVYVWRPDVPKTRELPMLYVLHGMPSGPEALIDGEGLATRVRDGWRAGGARLVLAVPDGDGSHHRDAAHRAVGGFSMGGEIASLDLSISRLAVRLTA
jgi:S-formylglutathione hydrolase FrmB